MKNVVFVLYLVISSVLYSQDIKEELPGFPNYFQQVADTLHYYTTGASAATNIKYIKKETVYGEESYTDYEKYFNVAGVELTKSGKPITKVETVNDSVKIKKLFVLDGYPEADTRALDDQDYYLSQLITYTPNSAIQSVTKYNGNGTKEVKHYTYDNKNRLVEIQEELFLGVSEDHLDTETAVVYFQVEPTIRIVTTASYSNNHLAKISSTKESKDFNIGFYTTRSEQEFYYGEALTPVKVIETAIEISTDSGIKKETSKDLEITYNSDGQMSESLIKLRENEQELERINTYYSYGDYGLSRINRLRFRGSEEQQNHSLSYNASGTVVALVSIKEAADENVKEKEIYTFEYY
ncbi:hypothetical protein [Lacinutrix sp. Hel_I_90]|uniref:hypothetical protein n=1 Tax=Lacinutrix sp. Hel_I_90 TaxID=1249999 RepID=UPI0005CA0AA8|nr:hypothetical protein [Lacinutrix sp. Hel_I_90]